MVVVVVVVVGVDPRNRAKKFIVFFSVAYNIIINIGFKMQE
jgi:hypothetical protein